MSDGDQAIRDVVKGASVVYVGLFLELLIAFVAQVVAARYLSTAGFGGLTAGTALLDVGAIIGSLGLAAGLTRYLPRVSSGEKRLLAGVTLGVACLSSTILGLVVSLNAEFIASSVFSNPGVAPSIRIFGAAIPFATILNVAIGGIRGQELSVSRVVVKNVLHPLLRVVLVVVVVLYGLGQAGVAVGYALPYVGSAAVALGFFYRSLPTERGSVTRDRYREMFRYSLPFAVTGMSSFVYRSIDIFLVLALLGDAATGIYGVAYAAVSFMDMFSAAFNYLASPIASRLENEGDIENVMRMFRSVTRWLVLASVCMFVPLGIFAGDFIGAVYGNKYVTGGLALTVLAVAYWVKNLFSINNSILEAFGRSKTLSVNNAAAAVTNVKLNLLLIPTLGIVGASVATLAAFAVRDGLAAIQVYRAVGMAPYDRQSIYPLVLSAPFLIAVWILSGYVPGTILWLITVTALSTGSYLIGVLIAFGISDTEVMVIRSIEERLGVKVGLVDSFVRFLER